MDITLLLQRAGAGDRDAEQQLLPLVYQEMKSIASRQLQRDRNATMSPTALVHETYLRMSGQAAGRKTEFKDRAHFFGIAARVMRNIVVDQFRHASAQMRDRALTVSIDQLAELGAEDNLPDLLALDRALDRLLEDHPRQARALELRYFGGLTINELAEALSITTRTAERDLRFAQAWLKREMAPRP